VCKHFSVTTCLRIAARLRLVWCFPRSICMALTTPEFNEHQREVFCVFSGVGVQRLRQFLNSDHAHQNRHGSFSDNEGTMYEDDNGEEPDVILNVTAQAHDMVIDEDEDLGDSEMLGHD
jgi:F-box and leucine-rich repeat protein GRR1